MTFAPLLSPNISVYGTICLGRPVMTPACEMISQHLVKCFSPLGDSIS